MSIWKRIARRIVENDDVCNGRQTAKYRSIVNALDESFEIRRDDVEKSRSSIPDGQDWRICRCFSEQSPQLTAKLTPRYFYW